MFTVKRTITSLITNIEISNHKAEFKNLYDAISYLEKQKTVDRARFELLKSKYPDYFFSDSSCSKTFYHYTFGRCKISCEIVEALEDAEKEFFMKAQLRDIGGDIYDD